MHRQRYNHQQEIIIHHQNQAAEYARLSREWRDYNEITDSDNLREHGIAQSLYYQRHSAALYAAARELQVI